MPPDPNFPDTRPEPRSIDPSWPRARRLLAGLLGAVVVAGATICAVLWLPGGAK